MAEGAVDLTKVAPPSGTVAATAAFPTATKPLTQAYNLIEARENMRGRIAISLVWTLILLVAATFILATGTVIACAVNTCNAADRFETVQNVVQLLLTPIVGLVGAVAGFYFGEQSSRDA